VTTLQYKNFRSSRNFISERFASFTSVYRQSNKASHRFIYLDDLTRQDTERWLGSALDKEVEREFEYAFVYRPGKKVSLLKGVKAEYDYKSDINDGDVTNREAYFKIEVGIQVRGNRSRCLGVAPLHPGIV
jgi:hypothetical protein